MHHHLLRFDAQMLAGVSGAGAAATHSTPESIIAAAQKTSNDAAAGFLSGSKGVVSHNLDDAIVATQASKDTSATAAQTSPIHSSAAQGDVAASQHHCLEVNIADMLLCACLFTCKVASGPTCAHKVSKKDRALRAC